MKEENDFALVRRAPSTVEKADPGAKRILSCMVADTLALVKRDQFAPTATKFQIGAHELCEPDYLQVIAWAAQLSLTPLEVLRRLMQGLREKGDETRIEDGKFTKLNWDPGLLPLGDFRISYALELIELSFPPIELIADAGPEDLEGVPAGDELPQGYDESARVLQISTVALPKLKRLDCACVGLDSLKIDPAPALERLDCGWNRLSTLDLRSFPNLKELVCGGNGLLECLNLRHVPKLLELDCATSLIKELDLRLVPKLRKLNCSDNNMDELVLPDLPELVELVCTNSSWDKSAGLGQYLKKLDLRGVPNLKRLDCFDNALKSLDLSCVTQLRDLNCGWNLLTELDVSCVPMLEVLRCENQSYYSVWIETLDIRPLDCLKQLHRDPRTRLIQRSDQHF